MRYSITPSRPSAHIFKVTCVIDAPDDAGQLFSFAAWIPGSYMIREFAKNIITIKAFSAGKEVGLSKLDKATWRAEPCASELTLEYEVYAWDLSVRTAHLDNTHAYFNGTSVFARIHGKEHLPVTVEIYPPSESVIGEWRVATTLSRAGAELYGFGMYQADHYDDLIDHPVEITEFDLVSFDVQGIPHDVVVSGRHYADLERIRTDLKRICDTQVKFFGELPVDERYMFLVWVVGNGYGGLEHRSSCSLLCSRDDLPVKGDANYSDAYKGFLGLCSHEYFHTWNVKRIKPEGFLPYELSNESYTRQLWAFEGITSYYDDLMLVRSGCVEPKDYMTLLAKTASRVWGGEGRFKQSVSDSSFDAWTKFYLQDESAPNSIVSYYTKGSLIALGLDIEIRKATNNEKSLDDVMARLWEEYGKPLIGVPEGRVEEIANQVAGSSLTGFFNHYLYDTEDVPLKDLLAYVGVKVELRAALADDDKGGPVRESGEPGVTLGVNPIADPMGIKLGTVFEGGSAERAGLASGDVIVAIDYLKVSLSTLNSFLKNFKAGHFVKVHAFRRDELMEFDVVLQQASENRIVLTMMDDIDDATQQRRNSWLGLV